MEGQRALLEIDLSTFCHQDWDHHRRIGKKRTRDYRTFSTPFVNVQSLRDTDPNTSGCSATCPAMVRLWRIAITR